jgi:CheY-like chemotaxis protein
MLQANKCRQAPAPYPSSAPMRMVIADDDPDILAALCAIFRRDGFEVTALGDGERLVRHLERARDRACLPDVIIVDHRMPGYCGGDIVQALYEEGWPVPVILMTAFGSEVTARARQAGAVAVFDKPFDPDDLRTAVLHWVRDPLGAAAVRLADAATGKRAG